jgi:hypothetical protein
MLKVFMIVVTLVPGYRVPSVQRFHAADIKSCWIMAAQAMAVLQKSEPAGNQYGIGCMMGDPTSTIPR